MAQGKFIQEQATDYFFTDNLILSNIDFILVFFLIIVLLNTFLLLFLIKSHKKLLKKLNESGT